MRAQFWANLSWWQKTVIEAVCILVIVIALVLATGLLSSDASNVDASYRWWLLSGVPFVALVLVSFHAKLSDRFFVRSGGFNPARNKSSPATQSSESTSE